METQLCALPAGFPFPDGAELEEAARSIAEADRPGTVFLIDGLAFGAMPARHIANVRSPIAALVHHPLGLEEGLAPAEKSRLLSLEGQALALARAVIVPSRGTAHEIARFFGIPAAKVTIAEPGILRGKRAAGSPKSELLHIVGVGSLTPRKGFAVLIDALNAVSGLPWRVTIAGSPDLSPETAAEVRQKIAAYGLTERVRLVGQLDELAVSALYSSGDIFALASFYEGYGMAFAEAMAHGLPIVASGDGAVADTVPPQAGFVCAAGDAKAIANALRTLLSDDNLRQAKAEAAWQHGQSLPQWSETADAIARVLKSMAA